MSDERFVDEAPAGADGWREVWLQDRRYRPRASRHEWLLGFFRRLFRRATEPDAERQKNFNVVLLDLLGDLRRDIENLRRDVRGDIENVQRDVRNADEELARELAKIRELIPVAARRNDALIAALDQKIESVAVRIRDAVNAPVPGGTPTPSPDFVYRRLEDSLRGGEGDVRASVMHYVPLVREAQPVLDVGCGRGELLMVCREQGIDARGFDTNERSVADLRARGLDVMLAGIPECFASMADGSAGSIVAMHVVEHLPVDVLFAFFREAARVLRKGGLLIVETPNAESLLVSASEFWRDPTHLAPRHPAALTVLAREHGFDLDEVRAVHPFPEGTGIAIAPDDPPQLQRAIHAINDRLFAPQDLRLIARRR
ncbi:MAG TPA: class I SAM-dependent methyltransferase [Thermoanaerobaculia bacterium]